MNNPSKYWTLVKIDAGGNRQTLSIPSAETFLNQIFPVEIDVNNLSNSDIQLQMLNLYRDTSFDKRMNAERCLRCFISWEIEKVCLNLEKQFGIAGSFTSRDLFPYVLDDDGREQTAKSDKCFSLEILQSFDSNQSSLTTWINRKVKQHPALNKFLLECGIYLLSDWAILNDTKPKQLERILSQFHSLTVTEIQQYKHLLQSYHTVYRAQRLKQRQTGKGRKCQAPTTEQLQQILQKLSNFSNSESSFSINYVMSQLQVLAKYLREYRIYVRGGSSATESMEIADNKIPIYNPIRDEEENQTSDFLKLYRPQFLECLDNALATVTETRVNKIQRKNYVKASRFLTALKFFHCQGLSMTEIAKRIEMKAQFQVTRLLKLKEFRADVTNELLIMLKSRVLKLAQNYRTLESLEILESQIAIALQEQVTDLITEAEIEAAGSKGNSTSSRFSARLCKYLDSREE